MLNPSHSSRQSPSGLIEHSRKLFNAEPPLERLRSAS